MNSALIPFLITVIMKTAQGSFTVAIITCIWLVSLFVL